MSWISFLGAMELGLIYSMVAVSLYVSYRVLDIADLSVDGTFPLGAVVATMLTTAGHPLLGLLCGLGAGVAAGFVTAALQTWLKVPSILAGIITMTALTSVNLMITGGVSNLPIAKTDETIFTIVQKAVGNRYVASLLVLGVLAAAVAAVLTLFFRTKLGLSVRATGDSPDMVRASSINPTATIITGLCIAGGLVGLSGGLMAQYSKFGDVGLGVGTVVAGLASLMLGEILVGRGGVLRCILGAVIGSVIYRLIVALAYAADISPNGMKLVTAVIVAVAVSMPAIREKAAEYRRRREGMRDAATEKAE